MDRHGLRPRDDGTFLATSLRGGKAMTALSLSRHCEAVQPPRQSIGQWIATPLAGTALRHCTTFHTSKPKD